MSLRESPTSSLISPLLRCGVRALAFNCDKAWISVFPASTVAFDSWSLGTTESRLGTMTELKWANTNIGN